MVQSRMDLISLLLEFSRVNKVNNIYEHWPQWKSMYLMWGIKVFINNVTI
jgi:hypothetical protein